VHNCTEKARHGEESFVMRVPMHPLRLVTTQYTASSWLPSTCKHEYMRLTWNLLSTSAKDHLHYSDIRRGGAKVPSIMQEALYLQQRSLEIPSFSCHRASGTNSSAYVFAYAYGRVGDWLAQTRRKISPLPSIMHVTLALHDLVMYGQASYGKYIFCRASLN
jgi:hypothetical protein